MTHIISLLNLNDVVFADQSNDNSENGDSQYASVDDSEPGNEDSKK